MNVSEFLGKLGCPFELQAKHDNPYEPSEAWEEGHRDFWQYWMPYANPYEEGTQEYADYDRGWDAAMLEDELMGEDQ